MKIQCSCGSKFAFDVTPEMARNPVKFVCPNCGLDSSAFVNQLIAQELGVEAAPAQTRETVAIAQTQAAPAMATYGAATATQVAPPPPVTVVRCHKHPNETPVETCRMCGKPICPKCMELFGYVCSPLCRARATSQGISIPVFEGQRSVVEAKQWRRVFRIGAAATVAVVLLLGLWGWYAWFGCTPKVAYSVRFPEPSYSGNSVFAGKDFSQVVFLHGHELARHDLKTKKRIWSCELLDLKKIAEEVRQDLKQMEEQYAKMADNGYDGPKRFPSPEKLQQQKERFAAEAMMLKVCGENVWVLSPEKIRLFDWNSGKIAKEFPVGSGMVVPIGEEVFIADPMAESPKLTRIQLASAKSEEIPLPARKKDPAQASTPTAARKNQTTKGGLKAGPSTRPLDPASVAAEVEALPFQAQIALPALLSVKLNQDRLMAEMNGAPAPQSPEPSDEPRAAMMPTLIPTKEGVLGMSVKLVESKIIERSAMKAPPAKSALDGSTRASQSLEVANEILNEIQRERGGDKVREDLSSYEVTLKTVGTDKTWTGEVTGPPRLVPLKTINVLVSSKAITVFDKSLKQLWQTKLSYDVPVGFGAFGLEEEDPQTPNTGPCIERKNTLYLFDEGVLSAFDLRSGAARWRLPTVGIDSIYFDDEDMLYVNTTTASHEKLKYSRQIDLTDIPGAVMMKVHPKDGKVLWRNGTSGWVSQIMGKYVFAVSSYAVPEEVEALRGTSFETGFEKRAHLRIRRINPKNGKTVWEHYEERAPLDIQFEENFIRLVFRKEVEILKYMKL